MVVEKDVSEGMLTIDDKKEVTLTKESTCKSNIILKMLLKRSCCKKDASVKGVKLDKRWSKKKI